MSEFKSPKPESLEAKFRLMTLAPFDKRMKRKHLAVYGFIIDWYHTKYGNALASVRHVTKTMKERDPSGEGFYLGDVHGALTDLVAWGYLTQEKGSGRRASRYVPVWSKSDSVCNSPNTTSDDPSVLETPNTSVRETPNATADSVRDSTNEDPFTGPGHKTEVRVSGKSEFEAAPVAPPAAALKGAAAEPASGDGFEEFWNAWPRKHAIKKTRAEWKKIIFDVDIVIEAARDWAAHYAKHGTDKKWIPEPANWLSGERWREDLPLIHGDAKGAAIAKAKANAPLKMDRAEVATEVPAEAIATEPRLPPAWLLNKVSGQPRAGSYPVEITETGIDRPEDGMIATLTYTMTERPHRGAHIRHVVMLEGTNAHVKAEGHRQFAAITRASGFQSVEDTDELLGAMIMITIGSDGTLETAIPYQDMEDAA